MHERPMTTVSAATYLAPQRREQPRPLLVGDFVPAVATASETAPLAAHRFLVAERHVDEHHPTALITHRHRLHSGPSTGSLDDVGGHGCASWDSGAGWPSMRAMMWLK